MTIEQSIFLTKSIFANKLSLNYKVGSVTIIPELRVETANNNFYLKKDESGTNSKAFALITAIYKF